MLLRIWGSGVRILRARQQLIEIDSDFLLNFLLLDIAPVGAARGLIWAAKPCDLLDADVGRAPPSHYESAGGDPMTSPSELAVDAEALREEVKHKYREVATDPHGAHHFHTGRFLAKHLGYDETFTASLPDVAVESFAGVANPFSLHPLSAGERVVDVGSGAGFDSFVAAHQVGPSGKVVGIDMTEEMLAKSRSTSRALGFTHVEFREGLAEKLPVDSGWADVVISNGVINLCADKRAVFSEIHRVLRPGGRLQFADIANSKPVPPSAVQNIDLWTA